MYEESVSDFLEHYGIPGMKWGRRKRSEDSGSGRSSKQKKNEDRDARRKARSDKILAKANGVQKQIDDLNKNGVNSKYLKDKYGSAMGVDTRAADMKILLLHGNSKKQLLEAELTGLEASKKHFLDDADAAANGRLTSTNKMLIGYGVGAAVLVGVVGSAVISSKMADKKLNAIKAGDKLDFDQYWAKLRKTEMSRVSGISKDAFDKMDDTPISVPAGHIFKRVSTDKEEVLRERIFAAYKDEDVTRYQAALPKFWESWGIGGSAKGGYVVSIKAKEAITSPSQKARVKAYMDLLDENVQGKDFFNDKKSQTGKAWLEDLGIDITGKGKTTEEVALNTYRDFSLRLAQGSTLGSAYYDKIKKAGYNAIIDDNDAGKLSDSPMMIFNTSKSMERVGATVLSPANIQAAKDRLTELANRA